MEEIKVGDTVYIVRHHMKNHKNVGYYIDKCRVCDFGCEFGKGIHKPPYKYVYIDHNLESLNDIPKKTAKRIYVWDRVHKDIKEAQKECDLKNKLIKVRNKYNSDIQKLKEEMI